MCIISVLPYLPYSAKFWRGKILANRSFQTFGEENVGELLMILSATLANLEFGWVKYWRMMYSSPNSPKFSPARILRYTVYPLYVLVMYDNDFTTILIIMVFMSRYDNYHDSKPK